MARLPETRSRFVSRLRIEGKRRQVGFVRRREPAARPGPGGIVLAGKIRGQIECAARGRLDRRRQRRAVAAVAAVSPADHKIQRVPLRQRQFARVRGRVRVAAEIELRGELRPPVVKKMHVGGGLEQAGERGRDAVAVRRRRGPTDDAVLAVGSGMQRHLLRRPGEAERRFHRLGGRVQRRPRFAAGGAVPDVELGKHLIVHAGQIPAAAVEEHHACFVQLADQRQRGRRQTEVRRVPDLVQQSPDHHAGMIAVAADQLGQGTFPTLGQLRRVLHAPRGERFLINHQPDLVAEVELRPLRAAPDESDHIEPHDLQIEQVAAGHVGIGRQLQADGEMIAGVRRAQEQTPTIEAEATVLEPELAEAATHRATVVAQACGDAIEKGIVQLPQPRLVHLDLRFDQRVARRQLPLKDLHSQRLAAGRRRDRELQSAAHRRFVRVAHVGPNLDLTRPRLGAGKQILHAHGRCREQLHRTGDPAVVVSRAGVVGNHAGLLRRFRQHDAIDPLVRRVQHADREQVARAGADRLGHVDHERRLAALVLADARAIQPNLRQIIHRPEPQQIPPASVQVGRRVELAPIPRDAVIPGERVLDDPRHLRRYRLVPWRRKPLRLASLVLRVRRNPPAVAIERLNGRSQRLRVERERGQRNQQQGGDE